ncbi:MAG: PEGA domain-containing protein [Endomicrobium sp.]|nr:PEGA domain-containing protein [Endomicrobium sp.]
MKKHFLVVLLLILSFTLTSCALMFNGTRESVSIKSLTPDSKIYIDGNYEGRNSVSANLKRNQNHSIIVKKEGCKTESINVGNHVQAGWVVFDVLFNWSAFLTDAITGAWNALDKTNIVIELEPKNKKKIK